MWDEEWENGSLDVTTGEKLVYASLVRTKNFIPVIGGETYYVVAPTKSQTSTYNGVWVLFYNEQKHVISDGLPNGSQKATNARRFINQTLAIPSNCRYIMFYCQSAYGNTYTNDISINYPSTDHDYHAYEGTTHTTSLGRTVYGGVLEQVGGSLTDKMKVLDMGTLSWTKYDTPQGTLFRSGSIADASMVFNSTNYICSNYATAQSSARANGTISCAIAKSVDVIDNGYSDATSFKTAMSGVQLCYEFATPQTYQLTPTEVALLEGQNNIWTDSGEVEVTYKADVGLYIDKKLNG